MVSLDSFTNLIQIITKLPLELFLPNVFQNGFSSTIEAAPREKPEPKPHQMDPKYGANPN